MISNTSPDADGTPRVANFDEAGWTKARKAAPLAWQVNLRRALFLEYEYCCKDLMYYILYFHVKQEFQTFSYIPHANNVPLSNSF